MGRPEGACTCIYLIYYHFIAPPYFTHLSLSTSYTIIRSLTSPLFSVPSFSICSSVISLSCDHTATYINLPYRFICIYLVNYDFILPPSLKLSLSSSYIVYDTWRLLYSRLHWILFFEWWSITLNLAYNHTTTYQIDLRTFIPPIFISFPFSLSLFSLLAFFILPFTSKIFLLSYRNDTLTNWFVGGISISLGTRTPTTPQLMANDGKGNGWRGSQRRGSPGVSTCLYLTYSSKYCSPASIHSFCLIIRNAPPQENKPDNVYLFIVHYRQQDTP